MSLQEESKGEMNENRNYMINIMLSQISEIIINNAFRLSEYEQIPFHFAFACDMLFCMGFWIALYCVTFTLNNEKLSEI